MRQIYETDSDLELARVKSLLEENNIEYYVKNEFTKNRVTSLGIYSNYDNLIGSYQIFVDDTHYENACELINYYIDDFESEEINTKDSEEENFQKDNFMEKNNKIKRDLRILAILVSISIFIPAALFSIPYYIRLKGKYKRTKIVLFALQIVFLLIGILTLIYYQSFIFSFFLLADLLLLVIFSTIKSIKLLTIGKNILGFLFILPLISLCIIKILGTI